MFSSQHVSVNLILTLKPILSDDICIEIAQALSPLGCDVLSGCGEDIRYYFTDMQISAPNTIEILPRILETLQTLKAPLASSVYDIESGMDHLVYPVQKVMDYCNGWFSELNDGKLTRPQVNSQKGLVYHTQAQAHILNGDSQKAAENLAKSFEYAPYIPLRNNKATLWLLEQRKFEQSLPFIKLRFLEDIEDGDNRVEWHRKALVKTIAPLVLSLDGELDNYPQIMAYYHHILHISSEGDHSSLGAAISLCEKHKSSSEAWKLLGDIHYEAGSHKKASKAFLRYFRGDDPQLSNYLQYMVESFLAAGKKLDEIDFGTHGSARGLYNAAAQIDCQIEDDLPEGREEQFKKIRAPLYSKSYQLFHDYYVIGTGSATHSGQHTFAMCCNNHANAITEDLSTDPSDSEKEIYRKGYELHRLGYEISPFYENLYSAANDAYYADDTDELIAFCKTFFTDYEKAEHYLGSDVFQDFYNYIVWAYWQKDDYKNMVPWYQKSEELFSSTQQPDDDEIDEFLKTTYYCAHELDRQDRDKDRDAFLTHVRSLRDWEELETEIYAEDREDDYSQYALDILDDLTATGTFLPWWLWLAIAGLAILTLGNLAFSLFSFF